MNTKLMTIMVVAILIISCGGNKIPKIKERLELLNQQKLEHENSIAQQRVEWRNDIVFHPESDIPKDSLKHTTIINRNTNELRMIKNEKDSLTRLLIKLTK